MSTQTLGAKSRTLNPRLRLLISPCRSGSTALLNCLAQHPEVSAYYQSVKSGLRERRRAEYGLFYRHFSSSHSRIAVDKETLGPHTAAEATLLVFPEEAAITCTRPLFLFRDPVATWNGWVGQGWKRYDLFELAYVSAVQTFLHARAVDASAILCLTYEALTHAPDQALRILCGHWGLTLDPRMLHWKYQLGSESRIRGGKDFLDSLEKGHFAEVQQTTTLAPIARPCFISDAEVARIVGGPLPSLYRSVAALSPTLGPA